MRPFIFIIFLINSVFAQSGKFLLTSTANTKQGSRLSLSTTTQVFRNKSDCIASGKGLLSHYERVNSQNPESRILQVLIECLDIQNNKVSEVISDEKISEY